MIIRTYKGNKIVFVCFLIFALVSISFLAGFDSFARESRETELREKVVKELEKGEHKKDGLVVKFKGEKNFRRISLAQNENIEDSIVSFRKRSDVEYAEPNYIAYTFFTPNDPYFSYQWHFKQIGMEDAWNISNGNGVIVAVIDTGVAYENYGTYYLAPDLANTAFVAGYDFVNNDTHPNDDNNHGTHVTGTVAQSTNNDLGVAGVAFGAKIMPIKVLNRFGSGTYADIAEGIRWAADNEAKVINMSLGGSATTTYLEDAVKYAYEKGVTIVAAAGNSASSTPSYPAAYDQYVISVGAVRYDKNLAPYSNYGSSIDVVAPGGDTSVDQNSDGYADGVLQQTFSGSRSNFGYYFFQGTSMASPHVAGAAALLISNGNALTPDNVRSALQSTAEDLGTSGRDNTFGWGLINPLAALSWSVATPTPTPSPSPTPTPTPEPSPTPSPIPEPTPSPTPTPTPTPSPEVEVFYDSFEISEWNGLWTEDSQNDWFRSTQRAVNGSRSAEVDGLANNASITSIPINLQGKTNAKITFSWYIENGLDVGEYVAFDVSTDNGASWTEKARVRGDVDPENVWHNQSIDLIGISNLQIRFRGSMSGSSEDADVDLVKVSAY